MYNRRNLCFISVAVCLISTVLATTAVRQPSNGEPLNSLGTCPINSSISVNVFRNPKGEWLTIFAAKNKFNNATRALKFDIKKNIVECGNSRYLVVSGFLKDTEAENFADVAVGEAQHELFEDGNQKNLNNNTDGEENDGEKRSYEIASIQDDISSLNKTLGKIQQDMGKGMEEVMNMIKSLRDQLNRQEESISTLTTCYPNVTLRFHSSIHGKKVVLSSDNRTATRINPREDSGYYGSVVTQRELREDEIFEFRIEETIDKWTNYGIGIGIIKTPKKEIETSNAISLDGGIKGTWAIWSWSDSQSGKSYIFQDGVIMTENGYNMDTSNLSVGTTLAVSRRKNGDLHFYFNGIDKGIAFRDIPKEVYAFVDIINHVSKISIVE